MAKKAILDVLESTIGKYVQNLDSQSLNVAVWNGQIELHNLALNIGAVNAELDRQAAEAPNLALPFRVLSGHFESLKIDVPWARITSRSVVFRAQGLHIQLEPCHRKTEDPIHGPSNPYDDEKRVEKLKQDRVHSIKLYDDYRKQANAFKQLAQADDEGQPSKDSNNTSFGSRLVRRIIENLQVEIEQVHISFRHHTYCSAGVVLEKLSLVTTDQKGNRTFVDRTASRPKDDKTKNDEESSFLYKVLQISGLGVYLDENNSSAYGSISEEGGGSKNTHSFILKPLSFEAHLRQSDNLQCIDFPKYLLSSELSQLSIVLLRSQLEHIHRITAALALNNKGSQPIFPEYRPLARISSITAKLWWQYAFRCVRRIKGKGRMWVEFQAAFQKRRQYIVLYKRHAHAESWMAPLTEEDKVRLSSLEADRSISVDGLMAWRSIADAQADLERSKQGDILEKKNKNKKSYISSFFTSSAAKPTSVEEDDNDPPITLTVEEMQELEAISMEQSDDMELSNDAWLCDLSFELGAFQIDLLSTLSRSLTTLKMGRVKTSFNANADGSFHFDSNLSNLIIQDLVTQETLFPMILRNLASAEGQQKKQALELRFEKSKTGDQALRLSMVAFEMVASPLLVMETKKFFSVGDDDAPSVSSTPKNPLLRQSLSGSVDLFFDADSGQASVAMDDSGNDLLNGDGEGTTLQDQLTLALAEAWKSKTKEKTAWTVDCDIRAPVLILPESCCHHEAIVLVFDLGHVDFSYGNGQRGTPEVVNWADIQSKTLDGEELSLDAGNISIASLGFSIGKAKDILTDSGVSVKDHLGKTKPVIEPVSATLNCGILSVATESSARMCAMGSFPSLTLRASPKQASDALTVVKVWTKMAAKFGYEGQDVSDDEGLLILNDNGTDSSMDVQSLSFLKELQAPNPAVKQGKGTKLFVSISVHRLSMHLTRNQGDGVEAHLVSASASLSQMMDGSSESKVAMGWFWILDMLDSETPRHQRLLAHSILPRSAIDIAAGGKYDIFDEIEKHISSGKHDGSSGLADIAWWNPGLSIIDSDYDPFVSVRPFDEETHSGSLLKAHFAALYVHWNPRAIKVFTAALAEITKSLSTKGSQELLVSPRNTERPLMDFSRDSGIMRPTVAGSKGSTKRLLVKATMAKFEVFLNSAKDDLPLYKFTMSDTSVAMISVQSDSRVDLEVGDLRVATPLSVANESYRSIIGLAPNSSSSLLSVKYFLGERSVLSRNDEDIEDVGSKKIESYADIIISPMRLVYLQAQVFALIDYVNDGILGALAAHAATSAANKALELAASGNQGDKIFALKAVGFDLVIPQSAKSQRFFVIHAGDLVTNYRGYAHPGGGLAKVSLGAVVLSDECSVSLVEHPLQATINAELNPEGIGTLDDQAMQVKVQISPAAFLLSKEHYAQMMLTLYGNISEQDSFLRGLSDPGSLTIDILPAKLGNGDIVDTSFSVESLPAMTHAGVAAIEKKTRMYVSLTLDAISLETFRGERSNPLARMEAVKMLVGMDLLPDQALSTMRVSLNNLTCQDKRPESSGRQFTDLFNQTSIETVEDVFAVTYTKDTNTLRTDIDMTIGAPRVIMIPDTIADLVDFVSVEKSDSPQMDMATRSTEIVSDNHVEVLEESGAIEATFSLNTETFSFALNASNCQIVLVDLGSSGSSSKRAATESIVVQGHLMCNYLQESEIETGIERRIDLELHGNDIEAYTAYGIDLIQPLSILEPTSFTAFYNLRNLEGKTAEIEIRAVTLANVDLTFSMQNVALLEVIASGLTESLEKPESSPEQPAPLSNKEAERITELASALASIDDTIKSDKSFVTRDTSIMAEDASSYSSRASTTPKVSPFHWKVRATLPKVVFTVVNDLQGLDEPLLRIGASNMVFGGEATRGMHLSKMESLFDAHINCTLEADYFDPSIHLWQQLLARPWEVTLKCSRGFLASLNGANRMWSTYSNAINSAIDQAEDVSPLQVKALAASAARKLITSLPYGVENATGVDLHFSVSEDKSEESRRHCPSGVVQYFRFEPPRGNGYGGRRLYGQEVSRQKSLKLYIENRTIEFDHVDSELGRSRKVHKFDDGLIVITHLRKEAKSMILRVGTQVDIVNRSLIPFQVSVSCRDSSRALGICKGSTKRQPQLSFVGDEIRQESTGLGLPADMLLNFENGTVKPVILLSPQIPNAEFATELSGEIIVPSYYEILALVESGSTELVVDTSCAARRDEDLSGTLPDPFVLLVRIKMAIVGSGQPFVEISLEPRATLTNSMPIPLNVKTLMPHTFTRFSASKAVSREPSYETIHNLPPTDSMEVFTPGPSFAVSVKCSDPPVGGGTTGWMKGSWVDLPMVREFRLPEPIKCELPFIGSDGTAESSPGVTFFVVESRDDLTEATFEQNDIAEGSISRETNRSFRKSHSLELNESKEHRSEVMRSYLLTVCHYAFDHTGRILFEQVSWAASNGGTTNRNSILRQSVTDSVLRQSLTAVTASPFSAFASANGDLRVSLLPSLSSLLRILQLTIEGESGVTRSQPFRIEDVSICEGGLEASPVKWEDGSKTGYFMYRTLVHMYQSEIHVVPEFIVYNASKRHRVVIRQIGAEVLIEPGKMAPVHPHPKMGLVFTLDYLDFGGRAGPLRVDALKHQIGMVKSIEGYPVGSIAVQTVIGGRDSRLVVKLGEVKFGESSSTLLPGIQKTMWERDLMRVRVRWSELNLTLCETRPVGTNRITDNAKKKLGAVVDRIRSPPKNKPQEMETNNGNMKDPVCTINLHQFTVDWQRIFKEEQGIKRSTSRHQLLSPERSQLSLVIHNFQVLDHTPKSTYPVVFDSTSSKISFLDLCVRTRGSLDADLVKVDLFDLNLAHVDRVSDSMVIRTSEDFVWKMLDISDRIVQESTKIAGIDIALQWDEAEGDYRVVVSEDDFKSARYHVDYTAPPSDRLIDVNKARVSPFSLVVTFRRQPQASRYNLVRDINGAKLVNYFTTRLKFTLDKAELKFARYEGKNIKGPPSRLVEILTAVYVSRMKFKAVAILSAANFQDWKYLAARDGGDDEFVDGDVLRITGNLAGKSANFLAKTVGEGLGGGFSNVTRSIGHGIENASDKVGARAVGAGMNSVVTGLGDGVGDTVKGVGKGAGKVLKGAGVGVGQIFGGVTGAVLIAGKGIGKGVSKGDGKAVLDGFAGGAHSVGVGVGQGVETAVMGAADGVLAVGQGIFSGAKSVGKGFGGVFGGRKSPKKSPNKSPKK